MKKIIIAVFIAVMSFGAQAQSTSEIELIQAAFGADKMNIVAHFVKPGEENIKAFEEVYD